MRTKNQYLNDLVRAWSKDDCLKYLLDRTLESLQDDCIDHLTFEFDDCLSEADVRRVGNVEYLINPFKGKGV